MKQYLDIVDRILDVGHLKPNRTGVDTLCIPFQTITHDMREGFPLLTTKKMAHKSIRVELEGFIKGITSKKWYQDRGCHIWDDWCNPQAPVCNKVPVRAWPSSMWMNMCGPQSKEDWKHFDDRYPGGCHTHKELKKKEHDRAQHSCDDLGPIYGYQWRHFGAGYDEDDYAPVSGCDQLKRIIDLLKNNPNDRSMVCSAWNPNQLEYMALSPCHYAWNLVHINGVLNLVWHQRSCDFGLGVPFNIASYALLLLLLCKESDLQPGILHGTFADAHIYVNHIAQLTTQLKRQPKTLPRAFIPNDMWSGMLNWDHNNFTILDYYPHPKIDMPIAV